MNIQGESFFSSYGEDNIILHSFGENSIGKYLDIGCNNPIYNNNTYKLYLKGWHGVNVDPLPEFAPLYQEIRPHDIFLNYAIHPCGGMQPFHYFGLEDGRSTFNNERAVFIENHIRKEPQRAQVRTLSVAELFDMLPFSPLDVDVFSLDVEGMEYDILINMPWKEFQPKIICCEITDLVTGRNLPVSQILISPIASMLAHVDYELFQIVGQSSIFRHKSFTPQL